MATAKREGVYRRVAEKADKGEFDLILPLDFKLIERLPEEGTTQSGLYPIGTTVRELKRIFPELPGSVISARVRSLNVQGLLAKVKTVGTGDGGKGKPSAGWAWQRTALGKKMYDEWKETGVNGSN